MPNPTAAVAFSILISATPPTPISNSAESLAEPINLAEMSSNSIKALLAIFSGVIVTFPKSMSLISSPLISYPTGTKSRG